MPGSSSPLEIQVSVRGDARPVYITGELDLSGVPELRAVLTCVILDAREVLIDLEQLEFMGSSGLRCLLECQASCQRSQTRFRLTPGNARSCDYLRSPECSTVCRSHPRSRSAPPRMRAALSSRSGQRRRVSLDPPSRGSSYWMVCDLGRAGQRLLWIHEQAGGSLGESSSRVSGQPISEPRGRRSITRAVRSDSSHASRPDNRRHHDWRRNVCSHDL
jgi:anti-anti-sigma factor